MVDIAVYVMLCIVKVFGDTCFCVFECVCVCVCLKRCVCVCDSVPTSQPGCLADSFDLISSWASMPDTLLLCADDVNKKTTEPRHVPPPERMTEDINAFLASVNFQ